MVDKKKIAKNTIALFIRMGILMIISLFTSRIILQQLGVSDYGTNSVVGGMVVIISFLTGPLAQGLQRYINYFLGRNEHDKLNKVFTSGITIMVVMGLSIFLLGETVAVFVLNKYLNIPPDRISAANWVLQFSLISVFASMLIVPFQGMILAHEDMNFYAYISLFEAVAKCAIVFLLSYFSFDKLILYAVLSSVTTYFVLFIYYIFCKRKYSECTFRWHRDAEIYKSLLSFSGWNILGSSTSIMTLQGMNIILNMFFGTVINAARGVAVQISSMVDNTISNIQTAMNPQLTQLFAQGRVEEMKALLFDNFKWNFYLYWLLGLPLFLKVDYFLELWLGKGYVPEYTGIFIKIIVIRCLLKCFERPLNTVLFATGDVKVQNIFSSSSYVVEIVLAIFLFILGFPPYWCFILDLFIILSIVVFQMIYTQRLGIFKFKEFFTDVIKPLFLIVIITLFLTLVVCSMSMSELVGFIVVCISSLVISCVCIVFIGLSKMNRAMAFIKIKSIFAK